MTEDMLRSYLNTLRLDLNLYKDSIKEVSEDIYNELGINRDLPYKNPKTKEELSINAYYDLLNIVKVYNEGTILDWANNNNQYKYLPYRFFSGESCSVGSSGWFASRDSSAGLYFKSKELSDNAVMKFRSIYDNYWM